MRKGKGGVQVPREGHTMDGNRNTPMTWQHLDNGVAKGGWHAVGIMENGWASVGAKWDGKSRVGRDDAHQVETFACDYETEGSHDTMHSCVTDLRPHLRTCRAITTPTYFLPP